MNELFHIWPHRKHRLEVFCVITPRYIPLKFFPPEPCLRKLCASRCYQIATYQLGSSIHPRASFTLSIRSFGAIFTSPRSLLQTNGEGKCLAYWWIVIPFDSENPRQPNQAYDSAECFRNSVIPIMWITDLMFQSVVHRPFVCEYITIQLGAGQLAGTQQGSNPWGKHKVKAVHAGTQVMNSHFVNE